MSKVKLLLFSIASGAVFSLAWPEIGSLSALIYVAFVPLLYVEHSISKRKGLTGIAVFLYSYLSFLVFNLCTTYWIYFASDWGAVMAIVCNALFMAIVFWAFHITKKKVGRKEGYLGLIIFWLAFEYLHLNWELSWPWLTLGNVFANDVKSIQWYEYTGILGGSLYILIANLLLFRATIEQKEKENPFNRYYLFFILLIGLSRLISYAATDSEKESITAEVEAVIVQPNIDPYKEKYNGLSPAHQVHRMVDLAREKLTPQTEYLILPETAFPEAYWEHELEYIYGTEKMKELIDDFPQLKIIVGASTSILYTPGMKLSSTANQFSDGSGWYDNYNTAIQIDSSNNFPIHHKSKLVLGVEKLPFIRSIPLMKKLSINLGGSSGGLGTQEKPSVFSSSSSKEVIAPIICYESIYGEYVTQYSQSGATIFTIITNDGWWDDTPGYRQHLAYARLRAIENRRSILRSANTGISAIIDSDGSIKEASEWWEQATIRGNVTPSKKITFYVRYGDYIGRTAAFIAPLLLLLVIVKSLNKTGQRLSLKKG